MLHSYHTLMIAENDPYEDLTPPDDIIDFDETTLENMVIQSDDSKEDLENWQKANHARTLEKEKNIQIIKRLQLKGITAAKEQQEILAKNKIHLTLRTIYKYRGVIKRRHTKRLMESNELNKTVEELALELKDDYDEVTRELWKIYHSGAASTTDKIRALSDIRKSSSEIIDKLQSLGLTHKEPEKLDINMQQPVIEELNMQFNAFIKSKWQDPISGPKEDNGKS